MSDSWYEQVPATTPITQGDLILACPVVVWDTENLDFAGGPEDEVLRSAVKGMKVNVVVMTQACDLEHSKVENVILCPHSSLAEYKDAWERSMREREQNPSDKSWKRHCRDLCDGFCWNLTILNPGEDDGLTTIHRIVNFHDVYTVPIAFLEAFLVKRGEPRLRLLPPYREHLSQAFARFFMRVGLPVSVDVAW